MIAFSGAATFVIVKAVGFFAEVQVGESDETSGLDLSQHSETVGTLASGKPSDHGVPAFQGLPIYLGGAQDLGRANEEIRES